MSENEKHGGQDWRRLADEADSLAERLADLSERLVMMSIAASYAYLAQRQSVRAGVRPQS